MSSYGFGFRVTKSLEPPSRNLQQEFTFPPTVSQRDDGGIRFIDKIQHDPRNTILPRRLEI